MDTTTTPQTQRQNFADFWQAAGQQQQQQIPSSSAPIPSMPPAFFYSPSTAGQRPQAAAIQPTHPPSQQPSSANVDSNEQQLQPIAPSTDPPNVSNAFQAALQPNHSFSGNFDFFGAERAAMAPGIHSGFRPPPQIGATPHFGPSATAGVGNFQNFPAGLLHPGPTVPLPSVVVSVGFDCMGLMNNFGFNSAATSSHSQFAVPQTPPALQSSSAALMPLAMSAIYATGGGGIQRSSSFLNNSAMANRPPLPLGQSASTGALSNGTANATNLQPNATSQLFDLDLSNNSAVSNATSAASVIAAAVTGGTFQQTRPPKINDDAQQPSSFGPFAGAKIPAEIAKIPKETASIPLESSREGTSSSSGGTEQRTQSQMSCQVCHLAASNGLHFGARTCAACAAFFRRSISDQKRYICKRSQRCVIRPSESGTQGYRKMCRNCRMKRCLEIGMLPENVQNKRNKREYYFVDALNNAIQQSAGTVGVIGQQQSRRDRQSPIMSIGMGQQIKNEVGKLLLGAPLNGGGLPQNGGGGRQQHPPQLNPVEKFEPIEKESPPIGMPNGVNNQQQPVIGQSPFQSVVHQPHLLAPIQMMGAVGLNNTQSFPIEFSAQKDTPKGGVDEGRPIYSTPATTTTNQQQQPMVAQFPWGITTLREI